MAVTESALSIGRNAFLRPILDVGASIGLDDAMLDTYGKYVAKVNLDAIEELSDRPRATYVVVTAITPTPLGEGKTTTTLGLAQALHHIGYAGHRGHPSAVDGADLRRSRAARPAAATARSCPWRP